MTNSEKSKRLISAIAETNHLLDKANKKYTDTITCLKMEIAENKEIGNDITANRSWIDYANKDKIRVKELEQHIVKLENMLSEVTATK